MRLKATGALAMLLGLALPGCTAYYDFSTRNVDRDEAGERAIEGAVLGAALGASVGAMAGINPGVGALIGTGSGIVLGSAIGVATTTPIPEYAPIAVPATAASPGYYDTWSPGFRPPSAAAAAAPAPPR